MSPFIKELKIKKLRLRNNLVLSPMAGITNYAFRKICLESGCGLAVSEMVSALSIRHGNGKSLEMLRIRDDRPASAQIFGSDPEAMLRAALKAEEYGADMLEINASCPMKKVTKTGAGASLMKTPELLAEIISGIARKAKAPLSVKIRTGWESGDGLALNLARRIQDAGADMLHVHLRTVAQIHGGGIDFETGAELKKRIGIPLIANGGVTSPEKAAELFEKTGCDGISVGRGAVANPLIFSEIEDFLLKGEKGSATCEKKLELFLEFLELNCGTIGEEKGLKTSRKLIGLWLKNFRNAAAMRMGFMKVKSLAEAKTLLRT